MAARLAARLGAGLCSGCTALAFDKGSGSIRMERLAYGGAAIQKLTASAKPVIVAVPPRSFEPAQVVDGRQGKTRELPSPPPSAVRIIEKKPKEKVAKDITEARVIVCAGRGFDKKEDLALARELADALGGELGATRPLTEEMHWLPADLCIGLSGVQVKPELVRGPGRVGPDPAHDGRARRKGRLRRQPRRERAHLRTFRLRDRGQPLRGRAEADRGTEKVIFSLSRKAPLSTEGSFFIVRDVKLAL